MKTQRQSLVHSPIQWNYEPCLVGPPKTNGSWWRVLTKRGLWRREWQTTLVFLPWEPHEQYEKEKDVILKDELPGLVGAWYAPGEEWRNSSRKNEEAEPKWKQRLIVDVAGDGSKVWCYEELYYIGTWKVRSMNQDKLEAVRQEMAIVNIDISGFSELKWTGMGEFNSDDHCIYFCGQESLEEME